MNASNRPFNLASFRKQFKGCGLPYGDLVCSVGNYFLGFPYKPGTLESGHKEKLVINFAQFDCFTFVETVLALSKCVSAGKISKSEFQSGLQFIRYRKGIINGYSSRLHYFSDWLRDNAQKGVLREVSKKMGAVANRKLINYMTAHRTSYPALKSEEEFQEIRLIEKCISCKKLNVIDKNGIKSLSEIQHGDIIAFASSKEGLDIAHVGFAFWKGRFLHLLHASSKEGSVIISPKTLFTYLKQNKNFSGIVIARPNKYR